MSADDECVHGFDWRFCPRIDCEFIPCGASGVRRNVAVVCTLRAGHTGPCCWWAARTSGARSDRGAGAPKDAG